MAISDYECCVQSEICSQRSDCTLDDPTFDSLEETRLDISKLSVRRKKKSRISNRIGEQGDEESDVNETLVQELDEEDLKTFERVQRIIQVGEIERLKVEECKIYLRKHGLRLSGRKEALILRIQEHIDIINGGGNKKYPASSFLLNCKGDACTGDIVMFEQNVYEKFNVAYRGAVGPSCGRRTIAGRIVKESYGSAKQQHTFTIEVLWSKGEKPLPPLHPLLIKGRNLYRLNTMRQKWENEDERQKMLQEKHTRGAVARTVRETRLKTREKLKLEKKPTSTRESNHGHGTAKGGPGVSVIVKSERFIYQARMTTKKEYLEMTIMR